MSNVPTATALAFISLMLGFGAALSATAGRSGVPSDWIKLDAGGEFAVMAPPGTLYVPLQGENSFVGRFRAPDFELSFDLGWYSMHISKSARARGFSSSNLQIDGKKALIVWELESRTPGAYRRCSSSKHWMAVNVYDTQPSRRLNSYMLRSMPNTKDRIARFYLEPPPPSLYPVTDLFMEGCVPRSDIELVKTIFQSIKFVR